jgi:ATP-binding cassette, subfamily B, bacterial
MKLWIAIKFTLKKSWQVSPFYAGGFLATMIILSLTSIVNVYTFKEIIESATTGEAIFGLSLIGLLVLRLIYEIFKVSVGGISKYFSSVFDIKQTVIMNGEFIEKVSTLDLATFENSATVGLIQRAFSRIQMEMSRFFRYVVFLISNVIELSVSVGIFFFLSPLGAVIIVLANLIPIYIRKSQSAGVFTIYRANDEVRKKFGYTSQIIQERETLPEIKVNNGFTFFKKRLLEIYKNFVWEQLKLEKKFELLGSLSDLLPLCAVFGFTIFTATKYLSGGISAGTFIMIFTNVFAFSGALDNLKQSINNLTLSSSFIWDLIEFYELKPSISFIEVNEKEIQKLENALRNPEIKIENLKFRYPNSNFDVLDGLNLTIPYGQNIALIGENGAGKSTLVKLLMRMYDPKVGKITINGIDIKELPEKILFNLYSTLFQNFGRFYLTFRENLELAAGKKLTTEKMVKYFKYSNAWNFVKDQKNKFDQQLGPEYKDGIDLSGGQWQRLAIARAYAKKAPILILDEPTSAVDAKSEAEIFDRLTKRMRKNTLIFISHRFSTIKDAERIVVLEKGKVIEDGTHDSLISKNGKYAKLYKIQAERYSRETKLT